MKKFIYVSGIISANLLLYGALFKVMHWPGASVILTLGIFNFSMIFLPLSLRSNYLDQELRNNKWLHIVTFIVFAVCLLGSLFKILHWPGAGVLLLISIPLPFILFLPVYLYHTRKPKGQALMNNLGVMFGLTFIAVFSALLALNVTAEVIDSFALNASNNETLLRYYRSTKVSEKSEEQISQKAEKICQYIEAIKIEMIQSASKNNEISMDKYNPISLHNKSMSTLSFLYENDENMSVRAEVLKGLIDEYLKSIAQSETVSVELKNLTKNLLKTEVDETLTKDLQVYRWVETQFPSNQLALVLDVLTQIQSDVRFVEMEISVIQ